MGKNIQPSKQKITNNQDCTVFQNAFRKCNYCKVYIHDSLPNVCWTYSRTGREGQISQKVLKSEVPAYTKKLLFLLYLPQMDRVCWNNTIINYNKVLVWTSWYAVRVLKKNKPKKQQRILPLKACAAELSEGTKFILKKSSISILRVGVIRKI